MCIKHLYFVTCCGTRDDQKESRFGYANVFQQVQQLMGDQRVCCTAFPIGLMLTEDEQNDVDAVMKARLSEENFTCSIKQRFDDCIQTITAI